VRYLWPERLEIIQREGGGLPAIWRKSRLARLAFGPLFIAFISAIMRAAPSFDLIHAHWTLPGMAAWLGQFYHRRPFVLTVHGSDIYIAPQIPLIGALTRSMLPRSRRVIANSQALAQAARALGAPAHRLEVIPIGIDSELYHPGPDPREPLLLFVGYLIERKGLRYLVEALPQVIRVFPQYRLAVIGEGPVRAEMEALVQSLGLAAHVTFVGHQTQRQVSQWMRRARLFILPSLEEAFGVVLLEALASGTPCIATRVGGIPEVIVPGVGHLVPPGDTAALAQAMTSMLADQDAWQQLSWNARAHVLNNCYSWEQVAGHLVDVYLTVLHGHV
jgi:glycosyltransferase involved in cell wall biosynthesis